MHDLSLYLLEMLENSVRAGAERVDVDLGIDRRTDKLWLTVDDDGEGLATSPEQTLDPFYTTKPGKKTGLGLSLLKAEAEAAEGGLVMDSSERLGGTTVTVYMRFSHVDRPPLGDVAATVVVMAATNPHIEFTVSLTGDAFEHPLLRASAVEGASRLARYGETHDLTRTHEETPWQKETRPRRSSADRTDRASNDPRSPSMTDDTKKSSGTSGTGGTTGEDPACPGCCEEASEEEMLARLDEVINNYEDRAGALIPVLQQAQAIFGYLPEVALKHIARRMRKPYSEVTGVVTFYSFFSTVPRGRNLIRVCLGTACYVRGGMAVLDALRKGLGIDVGETTEDREFSLEVARCFGACGLAPVITVNDIVHHRVKPARVNDILAHYASQPVKTGPVSAGEALENEEPKVKPIAVLAGERSR